MPRILNISQELKTFEGQPILMKDGDGTRPWRLKDVLLNYLATGQRMGLTSVEQGLAYAVGRLTGEADGTVKLESHQYDLLKKIVDSGCIQENGREVPIFSLLIAQQAKLLVDDAPPG